MTVRGSPCLLLLLLSTVGVLYGAVYCFHFTSKDREAKWRYITCQGHTACAGQG